VWAGVVKLISPLIIGSCLNILIGVLAITLFGIIILLLSKLLITVYLTLISSTVHIVLSVPKNSIESPNWIFLWVMIMIPETKFSIVVCIANPKLNEIAPMMIATSNPITWNTARILRIVRMINKTLPNNFEFFFAYSLPRVEFWLSLVSVFSTIFFVMI
jgi:hypothetical protein